MHLEMSLMGVRTAVSPQRITALLKAWMWSLTRVMRPVYSTVQGAKADLQGCGVFRLQVTLPASRASVMVTMVIQGLPLAGRKSGNVFSQNMLTMDVFIYYPNI